MPRLQRLTAGIFLLPCISLLLCLSGCDGANPEQHLDQADRFLAQGDTRSAMLELKSVLQIDPEHALARLRLAEMLLAQNENGAAEVEFNKALQLGAPTQRTILGLAKTLQRQDKYQLLLELDVSALQQWPTAQLGLMILRSRALSALHRTREAKEVLVEASRQRPELATPMRELARIYLDEGKIGQARHYLQAALDRNDIDWQSWILAGRLALHEQRADDAVSAYRRALKLAPNEPGAILALAVAEIGAGDSEAALQRATPFWDPQNPHPVAGFVVAAAAFQLGYIQRAEQVLLAVTGLPGEYPQARFLLGISQLQLGNFQQAAAQFQEFLLVHPEHRDANLLLANAREKLGNQNGAIAGIKRGLKYAPEDPELLTQAAKLALRIGAKEDAKEFLRRSLKHSATVQATKLAEAQRLSERGFPKRAADILDGVSKPSAPRLLTRLSSVEKQQLSSRIRELLEQGAFSEARDELHKLTTDADITPTVDNLTGIINAAQGRYDQAMQAFEQALAKDPSNRTALFNRAVLAIGTRHLQLAEEYLDTLLQHHPDFAPGLSALAYLFAEQNQLEKAQDALQQAIDTDPGNPSHYLSAARVALRLNAPQKALKILADAHSLQAEDIRRLALTADANLAIGNNQAALEDLELLLERFPDDQTLLYHWSKALFAVGKTAKALEIMTELANTPPNREKIAYSLVRMLILQRDFQRANEEISAAEARFPGNGWTVGTGADVLSLQGRHADAAERLERAYDTTPSSANLTKLITTLEKAGQQGRADKILEAHSTHYPNEPAALMLMARSARINGDTTKAIALFKSVLEQSPGNVLALNNIALMFAQQGLQSEAIEHAESALTAAPDNPAVLDTLGWLLANNGQSGRALPMLEKALSAFPDNPTIGFHYGFALFKQGQMAAAKEALLHALQSDFPQAQAARDLLTQTGLPPQ